MANIFSEQIYQSIDTIANKKLQNLKLDRTVPATIVDNSEAAEGIYYVEIQDGVQSQSVKARSNRSNVVYKIGTCVYVTIPQNNSSFENWILGSVEESNKEINGYYYEKDKPIYNQFFFLNDRTMYTKNLGLALAQILGGGDLLLIKAEIKNNAKTNYSHTLTIKKNNVEVCVFTITQDDIEGDPFDINDTQIFKFNLPEELKKENLKETDELNFSFDEASQFKVSRCYIGKSDGLPFEKNIELRLKNPAHITLDIGEYGDQATQEVEWYQNNILIDPPDNTEYSWEVDSDLVMTPPTTKNIIFHSKYLYTSRIISYKCSSTYDGVNYFVSGTIQAKNFPMFKIAQPERASGQITLTVKAIINNVELDPDEGFWNISPEYQWQKNKEDIEGAISDTYVITSIPKEGDPEYYTCIITYKANDEDKYKITTDPYELKPEPEAPKQGMLGIVNGNALLVWNEANEYSNGDLELSVNIYDINGDFICNSKDSDFYGKDKFITSVKWTLLAGCKMLQLFNVAHGPLLSGQIAPSVLINGAECFDEFDLEKDQIKIEVTLDKDYLPENREVAGYSAIAYTAFNYTQQGMPGTNGSKYIIKPMITNNLSNKFNILEYGYINTSGLNTIYLKPAIWDIELNQWLKEDAYTWSSDFLYTTIRCVSKDAELSDDERHVYKLNTQSVGFSTTQNIVQLTVTIDDKKYYGYLPIVVGKTGWGLDGFKKFLNKPFFSVIYSPTANYPFYRYKDKGYDWGKMPVGETDPQITKIKIRKNDNSKYLDIINEKKVYVKSTGLIFKNDGENEIINLQGIDDSDPGNPMIKFSFYIPILFTTITSLYDFVGTWNGSSAKVGDDYIVAPVAAFGEKDDENKFTGLVLGQTRAADNWKQEFVLRNLRFPNDLNIYSKVLFGQDADTSETFVPKKTHIIPIKKCRKEWFLDGVLSYYSVIDLQKYSLNGIDYPYIILSENQRYNNKKDAFYQFILYNIDWDKIQAGATIYKKTKAYDNIVINCNEKVDFNGIYIDWYDPNNLDYHGDQALIWTALKLTETNDCLGMIAYEKNQRTFELDANTGKISIGKINSGQIVIDPENNMTAIYGGKYKKDEIIQLGSFTCDFYFSSRRWNYKINFNNKGSTSYSRESNFPFFYFHYEKNGSKSPQFIQQEYNSISIYPFTEEEYDYYINSQAESGDIYWNDNSWTPVFEKFCDPILENWFMGSKLVTYTGSGMLINLSEPGIYWGNGNFSIDSNGYLTAKNAEISGNKMQIGDVSLTKSTWSDNNPLALYLFPFNIYITCTNTNVNYYRYKIVAKNPDLPSTELSCHFITNGEGSQYYYIEGNKNRERIVFKLKVEYYNWDSIATQQSDSIIEKYWEYNSVKQGDYYEFGQDDKFIEVNPLYLHLTRFTLEASHVIWVNGEEQPVGNYYVPLPSVILPISTDDTTTIECPAQWGSYSYGFHVEEDKRTLSDKTLLHNGDFVPGGNNTYTLGNSIFKWKEIYAQTATINTSDRNLKKSIENLPTDYLNFYDKLLPVRFKFKENTSNRYHIGFISQDVENALQESNLSSQDFAGFIKDGPVYGLRYGEFIALCVAKTQQQDKEIKQLQSEILDLKNIIQNLLPVPQVSQEEQAQEEQEEVNENAN